MTKQHFDALAQAFRNQLAYYTAESDEDFRDGYIAAVKAVAQVCVGANPRFDRAVFLRDVGVEP